MILRRVKMRFVWKSEWPYGALYNDNSFLCILSLSPMASSNCLGSRHRCTCDTTNQRNIYSLRRAMNLRAETNNKMKWQNLRHCSTRPTRGTINHKASLLTNGRDPFRAKDLTHISAVQLIVHSLHVRSAHCELYTCIRIDFV